MLTITIAICLTRSISAGLISNYGVRVASDAFEVSEPRIGALTNSLFRGAAGIAPRKHMQHRMIGK